MSWNYQCYPIEHLRRLSYDELNRLIDFLELRNEAAGIRTPGAGGGNGVGAGKAKYVVPVSGGRIGEALAKLRELTAKNTKKER